MSDASLLSLSAVAAVAALDAGEVSPPELVDALADRVAAVDGTVNALPITDFDMARDRARELSALRPRERGRLRGLPVAIKDLSEVAGMRTTFGSPIFADLVPTADAPVVSMLRDSGAVFYAKSNTPEFGAGANTFNEVFGATRNPWNTALSAAGSSGGSAVALATGMAWLAHGSDMGGSLRNPASFNNIVGMRPSPGRVADSRINCVDDTLGVEGPMARTVADLALCFDAMCGPHPADPISKERPPVDFAEAMRTPPRLRRVAWSADLGITPVDPEVAEITRAAAARFAEAGVEVEEAHPDMSGAHESFQTLRAASFATGLAPLLDKHRDKLKPEVVWNVEKGLALTADDIARAEHQRALLMRRMMGFLSRYDLLLTPATIVAAYPVEQRYVERCDGVEFGNYVEWLAIAYAVTLTCCPALSLPAGFTADGRPVGLQMIAPVHGEAGLLASAALLESILGLDTGRPIDPRG